MHEICGCRIQQSIVETKGRVWFSHNFEKGPLEKIAEIVSILKLGVNYRDYWKYKKMPHMRYKTKMKNEMGISVYKIYR